MFLPQAPRGCRGLSQTRGFPDLPAGVKEDEGGARVAADMQPVSRKPRPLPLPTEFPVGVKHVQQKPGGGFKNWIPDASSRGFSQVNGVVFPPRLTPKPRRTPRLATGRNTSTSSSTPSVQPPPSKRRTPRKRRAAHPPPWRGRVRPPTRQQRSGLGKCLVRLLGEVLPPPKNDDQEGKKKGF